jgi:hypothetical protein
MDTTLWIIVYSKFSNHSEELIRIIESSNLNINFNMLNIDNKEIRKKLVKNNTFKITYVPCIIRIDPQGVASQYEANKAFDLIYKFIERSQPPQPPPQQPKPQSSNTPPQFVFKSKENAPSQTPILPEISTPIDKLLDIEETEEEPNLVIEDRPSHSRATSEKINISSVMTGARRSQENLDENKIKTPPETTIKQVQTGKKINIAEIMSSR